MVSSSVYEVFLAAARGRPGRELTRFREAGRWESLPADELVQVVEDLAAAALTYGVHPGDRVAVLAEEGPDGWIGEMAALACGAVAVPLDPDLPVEILLHAMRDSAATLALVSTSKILERVLAIRPDLPALDIVLLFREPGEGETAAATLVDTACGAGAEALAGDPDLLSRARAQIARSATAVLAYSPHAAGIPVGAPIAHGELLAESEAVASAAPLGVEDRVLCMLSPAEPARRAWLQACVARGATLVFPERGVELPRLMQEARPTICVAGVPALDGLRRWIDAEFGGRILSWAVGAGREAAGRGRALDRLEIRGGWRLRLADALILRRVRRALGGDLRYLVAVPGALPENASDFYLGIGLPVFEFPRVAASSVAETGRHPPSRGP